MKRIFFSLLAAFGMAECLAQPAATSSFDDRATTYVARWKAMAMAEQQRAGIPAAITLAQGVLETNAGASELAINANNHFGIKCKKEWTGETYSYTDDAPNECFRKYPDAETSYRDHSDYLHKTHRYDSCFAQSMTDYAAWAAHLKKAGYATSPTYAKRLIGIIEKYQLQQYTYAAMEGAAPTVAATTTPRPAEVIPDKDPVEQRPAPVAPPPLTSHSVTTTPPPDNTPAQAGAVPDDPVSYNTSSILHKNNLKGFYARRGDALLEPAIRHEVRYARLLELNDLPDAPLEADMFIYLERKHTRGLRPTHTLALGESLSQVAQAEGMQLRALRDLNMMEPGEEASPGVVLQLQQPAATKPATYRTAAARRPVEMAAPAPVVAAPASSVTSAPAEAQLQSASTAPAVAVESPTNTPAAEKPQPASTSVTEAAAPPPATGAINIANEPAVEEQEPADEFSRLKARLDKSVYGSAKPVVQPASTTPAVLGVNPRPEAHTEPAKTTQAPPVKQAAQAAAAPAGAPQYHVVKKGETAFAISRKYSISMKELQALNNLNFSAIKEGQKLRVK